MSVEPYMKPVCTVQRDKGDTIKEKLSGGNHYVYVRREHGQIKEMNLV